MSAEPYEPSDLQNAVIKAFENLDTASPYLVERLCEVVWQAAYYHEKVPLLEGRHLEDAITNLEDYLHDGLVHPKG